jgi:type I restriction enzyme M protein
LFFERGTTDKANTKNVWFYDMRTNMPNFGKRTPFTESYFTDFEKAYTDKDRNNIKDERFSVVSISEIAKKNYSLDLGLIAADSITKAEDIGEPIDIANEALTELTSITKELNAIIKALH